MGLGTMTTREMHRSDSGRGAFDPLLPPRAPEIGFGKETSYSVSGLATRTMLRDGSSSPGGPQSPGSAAGSATSSTKASHASYMETKRYLMGQGIRSREVIDAPNTFYLRNYAAKVGVDLTPIEEKYASAAEALAAAKAARDEAAARAAKAEDDARQTELALQMQRTADPSSSSQFAPLRAAASFLGGLGGSSGSTVLAQAAREAAGPEEDPAPSTSTMPASAADAASATPGRDASPACKSELQAMSTASRTGLATRAADAPVLFDVPSDSAAQAAGVTAHAASSSSSSVPIPPPIPIDEPLPMEAAELQKPKPRRGEREAHEIELLLASAREEVARERAEAIAKQEQQYKVARALAAKHTPEKLTADLRASQAEAAVASNEVAAAAKVQADAEALLAQIEGELRREKAALMIQSRLRSMLQHKVYKKAWKSVVAMQTRHRGHAVRALYKRVVGYAQMLKDGCFFLKFSESSSPHDRFVWLDDDMHTICWCHPNDATMRKVGRDGKGRPLAMSLKRCTEVAEGATTHTFLKAAKVKTINGQKKLTLKGRASLKKDFDQIFHPADAFSRVHNANVPFEEHSCFSLIGMRRTLDLVAPCNRVRDDWLWALRMMVAHWTTTVDHANVRVHHQMMGIDEDFNVENRFLAVDLLGEEYVELTFEVERRWEGMGIVIDGATNQIVKIEQGGAADAGGLMIRDVIAVVDDTPVTSIQNGYFIPRSSVPAALAPMKPTAVMTVFRDYFDPEDYLIEDEEELEEDAPDVEAVDQAPAPAAK